jgi:hypothetical protein
MVVSLESEGSEGTPREYPFKSAICGRAEEFF